MAMTRSKCRQCGLVNPANVTECKRCRASLLSGDDPDVPQEDQRAGDGSDEQPRVKITPAPLAALCITCGTNDDVHIRNVKRTYTPNWVWLFLPLGIIPAGLIGYAVQVKHSLSLPICSRCDRWRTNAGLVSWLAIIVCIFLIFSGIGFAIMLKSWLIFFAISGLIAAIAYLAGRYDRGVNPRYLEFTKERVVIDAPGRGRIVVFDRSGQQSIK